MGLLRDILPALVAHGASDAEMARHACSMVTNMCAGHRANGAEAGRLRVLPALQAVIRGHSGAAPEDDGPAVAALEEACVALITLVADSAANQAEAARLGLLPDLRAVLKRSHASSGAAVAEAAARAVERVVRGEEANQAAAAAAGLLPELQAVLRAHGATDTGAVAASTAALAAICADCAPNQSAAGELGLLEDCQRALGRLDPATSESTAAAVAALCAGHPANQNEARPLLSDLQATLRWHGATDLGIVRAACGAVRAVAADMPDNEAAAGELGLLGEMQLVLQGHGPHHVDIATAACAAVEALCAHCPANQAAAGAAGLLADTQAALQAHGALSTELTECACAAIWAVCQVTAAYCEIWPTCQPSPLHPPFLPPPSLRCSPPSPPTYAHHLEVL